MNIVFTKNAREDFDYWLKQDPQMAQKIVDLIQAIIQDPFKGLGKPEPLKHAFRGYWSRRINHEHRLVYRVTGTKGENQQCAILQCRFHYD